MLHLLSEAGRSFLRAFIGSLIVLAPGILSAPSFHATTLVGLSALIASLAAGLKAIQVFIPQLSFKTVFPAKYAVYALWVDSFTRAFLSALIVALVGLLAMPTLGFGKAVVVGLVTGAITAGIRAVQSLLTKGESPNPGSGLQTPAPVPAGSAAPSTPTTKS